MAVSLRSDLRLAIVRGVRVSRVVRVVRVIREVPTIPKILSHIVSIVYSCLIALLFDAAFLKELPVDSVDKSAKQRKCLVNHDNGDVGNVFSIPPFNLAAIVSTVVMFLEEGYAGRIFGMLLPPSLQLVNAQIILIVLQQFFKAAFCDDGQFMVRGRRAFSIAVALHNILFARACCLLHLVSSAVMPPVQEMVNEIESNIIDAFRLLISLQRSITSWLFLILLHIS